MSRHPLHASLRDRAALFCALLLPTGLSAFLLVTRLKRYSGSVVTFVQENRASAQILVQILSQVLAVLQLDALKTLLNFRTRLLLIKQHLSLDELAFRAAIVRQYAETTLSPTHVTSLVLLLVLSAAPGALWTGALTPELVDDLKSFKGSIDIPAFTSDSAWLWNSQFPVNSSTGSCPVPDLQGLLLTSAATATPNNPHQERNQPRLDNAEWSFLGRSYGVGSSPNLARIELDGTTVQATPSYSYLENGYNTVVQCVKNTTSDLTFHWKNSLSYNVGNSGTSNLGVYYLQGSLPNDPPGLSQVYPSTAWDQYPNATLLAWAAHAYKGRNIVSIATGSPSYQAPSYVPYYSTFNQTQCEITLTPTVFEVSVNTTTKTIRVKPHTGQLPVDPEPTGNLTFNVIASLNFLSRVSNSLYTSIRGDALNTNRESVKGRLDGDDDYTTTTSVADSFTAMADDILVAYGASQLVNAHDTGKAEVVGLSRGVRIGEDVYIYTVFAVNSGILLLVIYEAIRTRFWAGMTTFDFADLKSAMFAASAGGTAIADHVRSWSKASADVGKVTGRGYARRRAFASVEVVYAEEEGSAKSLGLPGAYAVRPSERGDQQAEDEEVVQIKDEGARKDSQKSCSGGNSGTGPTTVSKEVGLFNKGTSMIWQIGLTASAHDLENNLPPEIHPRDLFPFPSQERTRESDTTLLTDDEAIAVSITFILAIPDGL
ncbi:hypothetical protein CLAIMM_01298 [Cladophialophora immunda]|nr:hypothetical protein CLAIMM_01298 [Cladophialophora immunda]